ncbi:hypothetical protein [Smaragdicoccus niigatensis]|uniref:hypothetical protein n=1 Tax=Smaragdicoccus niigatensis TaxID=359359 RepID=UPI0003641D9D|nr:hypothetical protein [Smaragdicoccus niigatensis]
MKRSAAIPVGVALAGLVLAGCGGTGSTPKVSPAAPTTTAITGEPVPASAPAAGKPGPVNPVDFRREDEAGYYIEFRSPSGALQCTFTFAKGMADFSPPDATCVVNGRKAVPDDIKCDDKNWTGATLWQDKSGYQCNVEWKPTAAFKVLDYGQTITVDKFACTSERTGISCTEANAGFQISLDGVKLS